jgi:hypothetical protein
MGTRPLQLLEPFPTYTIQTYHAYRTWRNQALVAVRQATELLPRLDKGMEEARLAITSEFMKACCADGSELPYKAVETFDSLSTGLFVSRPAHHDNQRDFALAFLSLAETHDEIASDHSRLLQAVFNSPLFSDQGLPWLNDSAALATIKTALSRTKAVLIDPTVAFPDVLSVAQSRRLDDIVNWLDLKQNPPHPLA